MKWNSFAAPALACVAMAMSAHAAGQPPQEDLDAERLISEKCKLAAPSYRLPTACVGTRFRGYEPTYAIYKWTQDDESTIRAHFSFRYLIFTPDCVGAYRRTSAEPDRKAALQNLQQCFDTPSPHEWYLMYTGEFDFYWGTRASGPVINRISNPGFHYRLYKRTHGFEWFDVGIEHRSDGQTVDVHDEVATPAGNVKTAELAYQKGDHAYFDTLSRDTNYLTAETHYLLSNSLDVYARVKYLYFGNETEITWGPLADQNIKMRDYDRFRFILNWTFGQRRANKTRAEQAGAFFEWTLGDKALWNDSLNVGLYLPVPWGSGNVPLFARLHLGPMETLSNYTKSQSSFGIGLMFLE